MGYVPNTHTVAHENAPDRTNSHATPKHADTTATICRRLSVSLNQILPHASIANGNRK